MCLLELWFSQSTCPVVGLLGHMVDLLLCAMLCLVTQLCLTLCNPVDCSLPGFSVHWDFPSKNIGVGCHFLLQCMRVKSESEVAQSCPTLSAPWTAAHQAAPSLGSSRRERWSGAPSPSVVHHHCCPVNKVFSTIFLDSVYVH